MSGYYLTADNTGKFVATGDGTDIGRGLVGSEVRNAVYPDLTIDNAFVDFTGGARVSFGFARGNLLRGTGSEVTIYSRTYGTCTVSGADYESWGIGITTEDVDASTGNLTGERVEMFARDSIGRISEMRDEYRVRHLGTC